MADETRCGAKTQSGGRCKNKAGFRTEHPGFGKCFKHGGASENGTKAAARAQILAMASEAPRGSAKSVTCGLTCGDGKQRPGSGPWAARVAPCLQGDRSVPCQVSASRRSLCQRHKHIGHPTASSPRWHRRRSEPWLMTLPTPWPTPRACSTDRQG
jgi:hypothetical protein